MNKMRMYCHEYSLEVQSTKWRTLEVQSAKESLRDFSRHELEIDRHGVYSRKGILLYTLNSKPYTGRIK